MALNPGAEIRKFRESDKWQSKIGNYTDARGGLFRFFDSFMDAFGDDNPERKLRSGGKIEDLNNPTMGFDQKAHVSLVDIIPGHLAAIRREITILRTGDTSTPLTVYDFQRRSFTDQKTMDKVVRDTVTKKSVGGMFNWELQSAAKMVGGGAELNQNEEGELKVFLARLSRVGDLNLEPDEIRETAAYQHLPDHIRLHRRCNKTVAIDIVP
jgi:hypothetical protein